jgi:hypothetical protein
MNLLVREHFKGMSDEESDNYINAFFAGAQDIDFYSLIQTYTTLDQNDRDLIQQYLNAGVKKETIETIKYTTEQLPNDANTDVNKNEPVNYDTNNIFYFENAEPPVNGKVLTQSPDYYSNYYTQYIGSQSTYITNLTSAMNSALSNADKILLIGDTGSTSNPSVISGQTNQIITAFSGLTTNFEALNKQILDLKTALSGKTVISDTKITIYTSTSEAGDNDKNFYLGIRRAHSLFQHIWNELGIFKYTWFTEKELATYTKSGLPLNTKTITIKYKDIGYELDGNIIFDIGTIGENSTSLNGTSVDCTKVFTNTNLKIYSPTAFYCRQGYVKIKYEKSYGEKTPQKINNPIRKPVGSKDTVDITIKKPSIDVMKRIIMKTLSECFYFKKLEEDSPVAFKSLTEKLKYFHPAFHSTTPEGLNGRLTFLLQCLRPGDTIPIKGLSDNTDIGARNTTFGPPPICVLRIGDFYHSKIIIKDVNITYEEGVWDFNPEGIGVQPMIANVQLQITFIGGQGLDRPVEKLQNALSSNFFANTEMYDERSIPTDGRIGYENKEKFTKEFLQTLSNFDTAKTPSVPTDPNKIVQGTYIGVGSGTKLVYTTLIDELYVKAYNYTSIYKSAYESIYKKYGPKVVGLFFSPDYRTINELNINIGEGDVINMLGEYSGNNNLSFYSNAFKNTLTYSITTLPDNELIDMLGFEIGNSVLSKEAENILKPNINKIVSDIIDEFPTLKSIKEVEKSRIETVSIIDKLNYIAIYSGDTKIGSTTGFTSDTTLIKTPLTGFQSNGVSGFTSNYFNVIEYLRNFDSKTTSLFSSSIDFNDVYLESATISSENIKSILQVFLIGYRDDVLNNITNNDLFNVSPESLYKSFDSFVNTNNLTTLTIDNAPIRSNKTPIEYETSPSSEVPDLTKSDDIFKIFSSKNNLGTTLNFYK